MSFCRLLRRSFSSIPSSSAPDTQSHALKSLTSTLYKERNLEQLVQHFKKSSQTDRFRTKVGVYDDIVRRLATAKRFKLIEEILEDQKKYKDISREGFSVRLISLYGKSGMFEHASKVFDEMPERNCKRTVLSFNALLGACVNSKKFDKVEEIFRKLPSELSVKPDLFSYNIFMKGLCEMGSFDSALSMLDEMEKTEIVLDLVTFNTLFSYLYGNGRFPDGEKIWARMESAGFVPDIRSYNAKLVGLGKEKRMGEAVSLVEEMESKGIKADVFSFNALIKGFCGVGELQEAKKWYDKMWERDVTPHKITYATFIPVVCEKGDFDLALELCKKVFEHKCPVDPPLLQLVADGLVKESKVEEAKELVKLAKSNNSRKYNLKMPSNK